MTTYDFDHLLVPILVLCPCIAHAPVEALPVLGGLWVDGHEETRSTSEPFLHYPQIGGGNVT
jgi:hypothetical protein